MENRKAKCGGKNVACEQMHALTNHILKAEHEFDVLYNEHVGFSCGSDGKESNCNVGDQSSIPALGRSPGGGHGNSPSILAS